MLLSVALGINLSQPLLDFVDIDLELDFPLYVDPLGFIEPKDSFAFECQADIRDFFETVLKSIASGDRTRAGQLLAALREPNETHLGISNGEPNGRGVGQKQAQAILNNLASSPAAKTGLLKDLTDCALFIDGIGADKVSDITTNIIRRHLIEYTQLQFERHGLLIESELPTGLLWMRGQGKWEVDKFDRIPIVNGKKILLVPKRYVRWRGGMQQLASHYYNNFVTNFIRDEQLRTNGRLVEVIKSKKSTRRRVLKKAIKKEIPLTKDNLASFSVDHPKVYNSFKDSLVKNAPVSIRKLMEIDGSIFTEKLFNSEMASVLDNIAPGRRFASDYHHFITGLMVYLFYPHLTSPVLESPINQGRKRIDISFANSSDRGLFKELREDSFLQSREIMVECKNYSEDVKNQEIDQMIGRFDHRRGRFGIILCRSIIDENLLLERCRDIFRSRQGAAIVLTDSDFLKILNVDTLNRDSVIQDLCREKYRSLMR